MAKQKNERITHDSGFKIFRDPEMDWEFVKKENGGAIASIAYTHIGYGYQGSMYTEGLNGYVVHELYKKYVNGENHAGKMLNEMIYNYLNEHPNLISVGYKELQIWILFGDPSLKIGGYTI